MNATVATLTLLNVMALASLAYFAITDRHRRHLNTDSHQKD